jgi:hypothetical protein
MPLNLTDVARNAQAAALAGLLVGGELRLCALGYVTLIAIPLGEDIVASGGSVVLLTTPRAGEATAAGTIALAMLVDADGAAVGDGLTVGLVGDSVDLTLEAVEVDIGDTVALNTFQLT